MTGALLAVASGQLGPDAIEAALAAGREARTGAERHAFRGWMVAEAKGLCLQSVEYAPTSDLLLDLTGAATGAGAAAAAGAGATSEED